MQCKCGGETSPNQTEIKTDKAARQWSNGKYAAPLIVSYDRCRACGRHQAANFGRPADDGSVNWIRSKI